MAQLALDAGSPGEAQRILEKGFAKGVFADQRAKARNTRLLETAKKAAASDQPNLPKIEKDADAASTGAKNFGVGLAYLGYGQYDKAVDQISKGLAKGGLRNEAEARLLLGIAQQPRLGFVAQTPLGQALGDLVHGQGGSAQRSRGAAVARHRAAQGRAQGGRDQVLPWGEGRSLARASREPVEPAREAGLMS